MSQYVYVSFGGILEFFFWRYRVIKKMGLDTPDNNCRGGEENKNCDFN